MFDGYDLAGETTSLQCIARLGTVRVVLPDRERPGGRPGSVAALPALKRSGKPAHATIWLTLGACPILILPSMKHRPDGSE
jgi:hypothetical protein